MIYAAAMRCGALLLVTMAGCGFQSSPAAGGNAPPDTVPADAPATPGPAPDAAIDAPATPPAAFCDPNDPALVVCFDFDDGKPTNKSEHDLKIHASNLTFKQGRVGMAVQIGLASTIDIDDDKAFDVDAFTLEAWVQPTQIQLDGANIVDVDQQYAFQVRTDGSLHCIPGGSGKQIDGMAKLAIGAWSHVACTYENGVASLYANGKLLSTQNGGGKLTREGKTGLSLGADNNPQAGPPPDPRKHFIGLIDQFRVLARARTAAEICGDAGLTNCTP